MVFFLLAGSPHGYGEEPAPSVVADPAATAAIPANAADETRGTRRAQLLRFLQRSDTVTLDPDPMAPPTMTEPLTLPDAVALALENNYGVKASKAKTEGTRWEYIGGMSQYLPRIDYEYRQGKQTSSPAAYHYQPTSNSDWTVVARSRHPTWSTALTLRQPVIDPTTIADILMRSANLDATKAEEVGVREKLALDTISSFLRLVQSRLSIRYAADYKAALDRLGQRMRDRVEGGGASRVELDRIVARSVAARSAEIEARAEYQAASVEFRRLTGVSPLMLALPDSLSPAVPPSVEEVLVAALRGNPDYLGAQLKTEAALANIGKGFSGLLPKLSFEFGRSTTWNSGGVYNENPDAVGGAVFEKINEQHIAAVFTWTLNGGVDFAQGMANKAFARQASASETDIRLRLEESVRIAYNALNTAGGRIEALGQAVRSNTKVVESFEEQYAAGGRPLLDLLDAEERLYQSQTELTRLLVSEATASYMIRRQMGELVNALVPPKTE